MRGFLSRGFLSRGFLSRHGLRPPPAPRATRPPLPPVRSRCRTHPRLHPPSKGTARVGGKGVEVLNQDPPATSGDGGNARQRVCVGGGVVRGGHAGAHPQISSKATIDSNMRPRSEHIHRSQALLTQCCKFSQVVSAVRERLPCARPAAVRSLFLSHWHMSPFRSFGFTGGRRGGRGGGRRRRIRHAHGQPRVPRLTLHGPEAPTGGISFRCWMLDAVEAPKLSI